MTVTCVPGASQPYTREFKVDQDVVTGVELKAGVNVLVFKVLLGGRNGGRHAAIHFTDAAGNPVKGLQVTLQP
jgi:hypothetical protein